MLTIFNSLVPRPFTEFHLNSVKGLGASLKITYTTVCGLECIEAMGWGESHFIKALTIGIQNLQLGLAETAV